VHDAALTMQPTAPPPVPHSRRASISRSVKLLIGLASLPAICFGALILLRICGLIRPFSIPTGAMTPDLAPGDHVMMEAFTYLSRQPRRGDIVVFKTDGILLLPPDTLKVMRVAAEPGEHVRISEDQLFVNGKQVLLSNSVGTIVYKLPPQAEGLKARTDLTVPKGCYFLLGDNSTNSADSRFWGTLPENNVIGRIAFRYWPLKRIGKVK